MADLFAPYGRVTSISEANGLDGIPNGVKVVKLETGDVDEIPHITRISYEGRNFPALLTIPGRAPLCLKCRATGHLRGSCPSRMDTDSYAARAAGRRGEPEVDRGLPVLVDSPSRSQSQSLPEPSVCPQTSHVEEMVVDQVSPDRPVGPQSAQLEGPVPIPSLILTGEEPPLPQRTGKGKSGVGGLRTKKSRPVGRGQWEVASSAPVSAPVECVTVTSVKSGTSALFSDASWADSPDPDDLVLGVVGGLLPIPDLDFSGPLVLSTSGTSGGSGAGGGANEGTLPGRAALVPELPASPGHAGTRSRALSLSQPAASRPRSRSRKGSG